MAQTDTTTVSGVLQSGTVTISNATSLSPAIDIVNNTLCGVMLPAAWTAAVITFQVSLDNTTFVDLHDRNGEVSFPTAGASRGLQCDPAQFAGWRYLKIRSGTSATPVAQGADRILGLLTRTLQS